MPLVGFEPLISAGKRPQSYVLDRAATDRQKGSYYDILTRCRHFEIRAFVSFTMRHVLCSCISGCKPFPLVRFCATEKKICNMIRRLTLIDSFPRNGLQVPRIAVHVVSKQTSVCACLYAEWPFFGNSTHVSSNAVKTGLS